MFDTKELLACKSIVSPIFDVAHHPFLAKVFLSSRSGAYGLLIHPATSAELQRVDIQFDVKIYSKTSKLVGHQSVRRLFEKMGDAAVVRLLVCRAQVESHENLRIEMNCKFATSANPIMAMLWNCSSTADVVILPTPGKDQGAPCYVHKNIVISAIPKIRSLIAIVQREESVPGFDSSSNTAPDPAASMLLGRNDAAVVIDMEAPSEIVLPMDRMASIQSLPTTSLQSKHLNGMFDMRPTRPGGAGNKRVNHLQRNNSSCSISQISGLQMTTGVESYTPHSSSQQVAKRRRLPPSNWDSESVEQQSTTTDAIAPGDGSQIVDTNPDSTLLDDTTGPLTPPTSDTTCVEPESQPRVYPPLPPPCIRAGAEEMIDFTTRKEREIWRWPSNLPFDWCRNIMKWVYLRETASNIDIASFNQYMELLVYLDQVQHFQEHAMKAQEMIRTSGSPAKWLYPWMNEGYAQRFLRDSVRQEMETSWATLVENGIFPFLEPEPTGIVNEIVTNLEL
ncbi:hypothetical protein BGX31_008095 [Mortierella sp. GBA43]|nr:hypothetical protein BGX31_008095 [Mortierella sp. GBA43]